MSKKFSQFQEDNIVRQGDISVGLRDGENGQFDFPGDGIKDVDGNYLYKYRTAGDTATNFVEFINSLTGNPPIIASDGTDENVGLVVKSHADGTLYLISPQNGDIEIALLGGGDIYMDTNIGGIIVNSSDVYKYISNDDTLSADSPVTLPTQQAVKTYVDGHISSTTFFISTLVATTANLSATYDNGSSGVGATLTANSNGAAVIDGISLSLDDLVLFKDQTSAFENGVYTVTQVGDGSNPAIYTRYIYFNDTAEIKQGYVTFTVEGDANAKKGYQVTSVVNTIGVDDINYQQLAIPTLSTSTDNAVVTFDGASGGQIQESIVIIDGAGVVTGATEIDVGALTITDSKLETSVGNPLLIITNPADYIYLNTPLIMVDDDIAHAGDVDNKITFGADTQNYQTGGSSRMDISNSGVRLGATDARITSISNDTTMAADSATLGVTQHAVKTYVDSHIATSSFFIATLVATTANLSATYNNGASGVGATLTATSNGAASIDGVSLSVGNSVLFKDQSSALQNGVYLVSDAGSVSTPAIYTRYSLFDQPAEINQGFVTFTVEGTVNAKTGWQLTSVVSAVGVDALNYQQITVPAISSSTDNALARWNGATGGFIQNSVVTIDDVGVTSGITQLNVDNLRLDGNTISSTDTNGLVVIAPNGTGGATISTDLTVGRSTQDTTIVLNGVSIAARLSVDNEGSSDLAGLLNHRHSDTAAIGGHNIFSRTRGTHASPTIVQNGDVLGRTMGAGYDGTDYAQSSEIRFEVDGTPGSNDMPGRIVFLTSPDGAQVPVEALRLSANQSTTFGGTLYVTGHNIEATSGNITLVTDGLSAIDLDSPTVLVDTDIAHAGDTNNKITFGTDTQNYQTGGSSRLDISDLGVRLGTTGARITSISDDTTMAADSSTLGVTQHAAKTYADNVGASVTLTNAGTTTLVNDGVGPALATKGLAVGTGMAAFTTSATDVTINLSVPVTIANGGTNTTSAIGASGTIAQSDGTKYTFTTATYPATAGTAGTILRSNATNWINSTSTFADTYSVSTILYASSANAVTGLATANSASLVTNSTGVPAWSSTMTNGQVIIGSTGATPTAAALTQGTGITITNGAGSITIAVSGGGALPTITNSATLVSTAAGAAAWTSTMTNGQVVIGNTGGTPTAAALTQGTGMTITNGAGTITIALSTPVSIANGGTNTTSAIGATGTLAQSDGTKYTWTTATYPTTAGTSGKILISNGTNIVSSTPTYPNSASSAGTVLRADGTNWVASTATYPNTGGTAGTILRSDGTNWVNSTATFANTYTASNLLYSNGSNTVTGLATANSAVLVTNSSGVPAWSSTMTNGQLIIGSTSGTPTAATLTAGTGVTITNGAGTITIAATTGGTPWTEVTGTSQSMAVNNGYIANNAGLVTCTLPTTAAVGEFVKVDGKGAGLFKIAQNASQVIHTGTTDTTTGTGGSLTATNRYDCLTLRCITANTDWVLEHVKGAFTIA